jgi:L-alanine-DL-glutamate epimerase-like enolase superfamily enzyme
MSEQVFMTSRISDFVFPFRKPEPMKIHVESLALPLSKPFTIARETFETSRMVSVRVERDGVIGLGHGVPQPRFGDTPQLSIEAIRSCSATIETRADLDALRLPGSARNALDMAIWDLEAKQSGVPAWQRAGLRDPTPVHTAYTVSLGTARDAFDAARKNRDHALIKVKLGRADDAERLQAIREAAPGACLIADANEAWDIARLRDMTDCLAACRVALVEQPLPEAADTDLRAADFPFHICADESFRTVGFLDALDGRYDFINIKLDKLGGFTRALDAAKTGIARGIGVMVGCAVGSSLSIAPAVLVAQLATYADLDGPLFLKNDVASGLEYANGMVYPPSPRLWG